MTIIDVPKDVRIYVMSDLHEHEFQFNAAISAIKPSEKVWAVSVGDICEKGFGKDCAERIINAFTDLHKQGIGFVVQGNHDIKIIKKAKKDNSVTKQIAWLDQCPLSYTFRFCNKKCLTILHGGLQQNYTQDDLDNNSSVAYIREVDPAGDYIKYIYKTDGDKKMMMPASKGVKWHEVYDGRFGYILAGHDSIKTGVPKFYSNSANLDSAVYVTGRLTVQMFDENGLGDLLFFDGPAKYASTADFYKSMALDEIR